MRQSSKPLYDNNEWANYRGTEAAVSLAREQLLASNDYRWSRLSGALVHMLDAESNWRTLLDRKVESDRVEVDDSADFDARWARWRRAHRASSAYIDALADDAIGADFVHEIDGERRQRSWWHFWMHLYSRGVQHRGEWAAQSRGLGASPGDMDFSVFLGSGANRA